MIPNNILKFLDFIGYGACHQRLNLSFNSYLLEHMPVCSRCTGICIGFILSSVLILSFERKIRTQFPGRRIIAATVILFAAMAAESVLSSLEIIPAYNTARFLTGYSVGWFLPLLLLPLLNSVVFSSDICLKEQYLRKPGHFIVWIFSGAAVGFIFLVTYKQIFLFWSIVAVTGLILLVAVLILTLFFASTQKLRSSVQNSSRFLVFFFPAVAVSLVFLSLSSFLKSIINPYLSFEYLRSVFNR